MALAVMDGMEPQRSRRKASSVRWRFMRVILPEGVGHWLSDVRNSLRFIRFEKSMWKRDMLDKGRGDLI
jgi:hypothetical protein